MVLSIFNRLHSHLVFAIEWSIYDIFVCRICPLIAIKFRSISKQSQHLINKNILTIISTIKRQLLSNIMKILVWTTNRTWTDRNKISFRFFENFIKYSHTSWLPTFTNKMSSTISSWNLINRIQRWLFRGWD